MLASAAQTAERDPARLLLEPVQRAACHGYIYLSRKEDLTGEFTERRPLPFLRAAAAAAALSPERALSRRSLSPTRASRFENARAGIQRNRRTPQFAPRFAPGALPARGLKSVRSAHGAKPDEPACDDRIWGFRRRILTACRISRRRDFVTYFEEFCERIRARVSREWRFRTLIRAPNNIGDLGSPLERLPKGELQTRTSILRPRWARAARERVAEEAALERADRREAWNHEKLRVCGIKRARVAL